ncbi:MAG: CotH kinase family protein, partial [Syntrophothermus sp.]
MKKWLIILLFAPLCLIKGQTIVINEVMTSNSLGIKDEDQETNDWIEIYNNSNSEINLSGFAISDNKSEPGKWKFPKVILGPQKYLGIFASGKNRFAPLLHTNFKLNSSGEFLLLSSPAGQIIDSVTIPEMKSDISYGRKPDGRGAWFFFTSATPGKSNTAQGYGSFTASPVFALKGGIYAGSCTVSISCPTPGADIYYTTDGSEPSTVKTKYTGAFNLSKTTTVRAGAFLNDAIPGRTVSESYIVNAPVYNLPVITLATEPAYLWSDSAGIYVMGKNASPESPYFGANFWQPWERPFNMQFIDTDGRQKYNADCGLEIFGTYSRANAQKSFDLHAREEYGTKDFNYNFFPGEPKNSYAALVMRNGGNDFYGTLLRDRLTGILMKGLGVGVQPTRFVHSYLNGEYWGIYCLREKLNEHFIASEYNVNPDSIDLLENENAVIGSSQDYKTMTRFLTVNSPSIEPVYEIMQDWIDIDNFRNYQIAEIFINNTDWPGNNVKCWREQKTDAKWHWIMFDTDFGYGFNLASNNPDDVKFNTLDFATAANGPNWPNPPWSTFLLRKMLENKEFKNDFIVSFIHLLNTRFSPDTLLYKFNLLKGELQKDISLHTNKWKYTISNWEYNCSVIKSFLEKRESYMRYYVLKKFGLSDTPSITLNATAGGRIAVHDYIVGRFPFTGDYPSKVNIRFKAIPDPGYYFAGWKGDINNDSTEIHVYHTGTLNLQAVFSPIENQAAENIVINEINYKSSGSFDAGDWVELYNNGRDTVNLGGWQFKDSDDSHIFNIPALSLKPGEYLVLLNDSSLFRARFPEVKNTAGN